MAELNNRQRKFCSEYIYDWNMTKAYRKAYPECKTDNAASTSAFELLKNPKIKDYIEEIQADIEKQVGISRQMVLDEHMKLGFSSIAHLHNTWISRKDFEDLTDDEKDCIQEIDTKIKFEVHKDPVLECKIVVEVEYIKVKLYDKQKSLDAINKMLGYNEPDKLQVSSKNKIKGITFDE